MITYSIVDTAAIMTSFVYEIEANSPEEALEKYIRNPNEYQCINDFIDDNETEGVRVMLNDKIILEQ